MRSSPLCEDARVPSWLDFDQIAEWVSGAWWSYPLIFAVATVDAFFPLVPSETVVIIGGDLAASGDLSLPLVILAAAAGAIVGDNISYGLGTLVGERTVKRWFAGRSRTSASSGRSHARRARRVHHPHRPLHPRRRTAVTFSAGYIPTFPWRRFVLYDAVAASLWATYAAGLGYFGGKTFENHPFLGLMVALGIALSLGLVVEAVRHRRQRRAV